MTISTKALYITHSDATYSNVRSVAIAATAWSNETQSSKDFNLLMPIALCNNKSAMAKLIRKATGENLAVTRYQSLGCPF